MPVFGLLPFLLVLLGSLGSFTRKSNLGDGSLFDLLFDDHGSNGERIVC